MYSWSISQGISVPPGEGTREGPRTGYQSSKSIRAPWFTPNVLNSMKILQSWACSASASRANAGITRSSQAVSRQPDGPDSALARARRRLTDVDSPSTRATPPFARSV